MTTSPALDGARLARIATEHGTPAWVYDAGHIRSQIARLRGFDVIRFAQKACSNTHILRLMRAEGVLVDAVSQGELERALSAGYEVAGPNEPIVLTADLLDRVTLRRVVELGVPVSMRLAADARPGGRRQPGPPGLDPGQPGLRARPQPQDQHRR